MTAVTLDLPAILEKHRLWLRSADIGVRANLREANLRWANLHEANLHEADLYGADLRGANLCGAKTSQHIKFRRRAR